VEAKATDLTESNLISYSSLPSGSALSSRPELKNVITIISKSLDMPKFQRRDLIVIAVNAVLRKSVVSLVRRKSTRQADESKVAFASKRSQIFAVHYDHSLLYEGFFRL